MKKNIKLLAFSVLLASCAYEPIGSTAITGNVTVLNEYGADITKYCKKTIREGGEFAQNAAKGTNNLEQITCLNGHDLYRIKGERLSVKVPKENTHVNFGDVTIELMDDSSIEVTGGNGKLKVAKTNNAWSKHLIGDIGQ